MANKDRNLHFKNLIQSLIAITIILLATYIYAQPDPKGIIFGLFLTAYGLLAAICSFIVILSKSRKFSELYYFSMCANIINVYLLYHLIISLKIDYTNLSAWTMIYFINLFGVILAAMMLFRIIKTGKGIEIV